MRRWIDQMRSTPIWSLVIFLSSCQLLNTSVSPITTSTKKSIQLWATYYYVPTLAHNDEGIPLLDVNEQELPLKLPASDWCNAAIQGSVYIRKDGVLYLAQYAGRSTIRQFDCRECERYKNYSGYDKTGKVRWEISDGKVTGGSGLNLVALKSIAVDPSVIPYKTVVFIPDAIGTPYLNERGVLVQHDGYFLAADTGSLIKGQHIDVYLGDGNFNPFEFVKSDENQQFQAFIVNDEEIRRRLLEMHK